MNEDPWDVEARRITAERLKSEREDAKALKRKQAEADAEKAARAAAYRALQEAVQEAANELAAFMRERGAAAQHLLAAAGERTYIYFGGESEGGSYWSVYLNGNGLVRENGRSGGYTSEPTDHRPATPQEAVEAYAYNGAGHNDPAKVRGLVSWLTSKVAEYARR